MCVIVPEDLNQKLLECQNAIKCKICCYTTLSVFYPLENIYHRNSALSWWQILQSSLWNPSSGAKSINRARFRRGKISVALNSASWTSCETDKDCRFCCLKYVNKPILNLTRTQCMGSCWNLDQFDQSMESDNLWKTVFLSLWKSFTIKLYCIVVL